MRMSMIISIVIMGFLITNASGQSILKDYFNGDKDSLVAQATNLINMPEPTFMQLDNISDSVVIKNVESGSVYKFKKLHITVRDNKKIVAYKYSANSDNTIILIHGVKSNGDKYNKTAGLLRESTKANVIALDLRGHGKSDGNDGDVNYIGQYADDLADVIKIIRKQKPKGKIIIAGHSMGGGVALNYAIQKNEAMIDGYLLFAPLLGHNSPAFQQTAPTETHGEEPFMKIHIARIIGLKMFNEIGDHSHDSLPVLFFNLPENMPSRKYTHRANMSMAPDDYKEGLESIKVPMLVLIGSKDEAFNPEVLKTAVTEYSKADVQIIEGVNHNEIRHNPQSFKTIKKWFSAL